jgi:hypothetical protein
MEEIFNILIQNKITPNQHYMLHCLRNKIQPTAINPYAEGRELKFKGLVNDKWELLPIATELLDKIDEFFHVKKEETTKVIAGDDFKENIVKYLDLFPKRKLPSGKLARSDKKNIESNFRWFFKTFEYSWDTVLKATAHYVDEYEKKNYLYMQTSQYFISKTQPDKSKMSELANYCAMLIDGVDMDDDDHFKERVV